MHVHKYRSSEMHLHASRTNCNLMCTLSCQDCAGVILYTAETATQIALDAIQCLGALLTEKIVCMRACLWYSCHYSFSLLPSFFFSSSDLILLYACHRGKWLHQRLPHGTHSAGCKALRNWSRHKRGSSHAHRGRLQQDLPRQEGLVCAGMDEAKKKKKKKEYGWNLKRMWANRTVAWSMWGVEGCAAFCYSLQGWLVLVLIAPVQSMQY